MKLSIRALASQLKIPYQNVERYEKGEVEPKAHRLEEIADILDTSTEYLLGRVDYPRRLTALHYDVWDAFDSGDTNRLLDLLRQYLVQKGIAKKPITRKKPPLT